ncbi:MAG: hypothetical protein FJX75_03200 [Armatimonadetes bacterium]|nr:hypothetical protein [Armatimonadota bacterium]
MGSKPPTDDGTGPAADEPREAVRGPRSADDDLLRGQARTLRPWAWAVLLACILAIVFVANIFLLGAARKAMDMLQITGTSQFWSVVLIILVWALWGIVGTVVLTAFRRWLRGAFGPVWRRALRRIPRATAAIMALAVGVMTFLMGGLWSTSLAFLLFVSLTWTIIVAASLRPPRL